jgi:hypothetical protein
VRRSKQTPNKEEAMSGKRKRRPLFIIRENPVCPRCGAPHVENPEAPVEEWIFNIRANKVGDENGDWWHQCMKCAGPDPTGGWFRAEERVLGYLLPTTKTDQLSDPDSELPPMPLFDRDA